jgi:hypothetical protein
MSYLGRGLEQVDNISKLDNITFNGGTTYALTKDSSAFTPISSNALLVSIDGVIQQGNFSVSGTNIVFNFSPTSSNTCDFIMHYGTGIAFTPADSSITKDKTDFISTSSSAGLQIKGDGTTDGTLQLNCSQNTHGVKIKSPAHSASQSYTLTLPTTSPATDKIMQTDSSGNLSFVDAPSGTHVLLNSTDATGLSDITFDNFSSTYNKYRILGSHGMGVNDAQTRFRMRKSGTDQTGGNYTYAYNTVYRNGSTGATGENTAWDGDHARLTGGSTYSAAQRTVVDMTVYSPAHSSYETFILINVGYYYASGSALFRWSGTCWVSGASGTSNTGIKFYAASGTIDNARYEIYGIKDS